MIAIYVMTAVGVLLTLLALAGVVVLRDRSRPLYVLGLLCLAASWFIPVLLSVLMWEAGLGLPWPANAIINVVLYTVGGGLLVLAALTRGAAERSDRPSECSAPDARATATCGERPAATRDS